MTKIGKNAFHATMNILGVAYFNAILYGTTTVSATVYGIFWKNLCLGISFFWLDWENQICSRNNTENIDRIRYGMRVSYFKIRRDVLHLMLSD